MKNIKIIALASILAVAQLNAAVTGGIHTAIGCVGNCLGDAAVQMLNAVGDQRDLNVSKVSFADNNLGNISATKIINIKTPTADRYSGYEVSFAHGELAGKQIRFVGINESEAGESVYKFFRKLSTDKLWTEVGTLSAAQPVNQLSAVITPDGALAFAGNNGKLAVMYIGTRNLTVPAAAKSRL